jgi:hypothetical protein
LSFTLTYIIWSLKTLYCFLILYGYSHIQCLTLTLLPTRPFGLVAPNFSCPKAGNTCPKFSQGKPTHIWNKNTLKSSICNKTWNLSFTLTYIIWSDNRNCACIINFFKWKYWSVSKLYKFYYYFMWSGWVVFSPLLSCHIQIQLNLSWGPMPRRRWLVQDTPSSSHGWVGVMIKWKTKKYHGVGTNQNEMTYKNYHTVRTLPSHGMRKGYPGPTIVVGALVLMTSLTVSGCDKITMGWKQLNQIT